MYGRQIGQPWQFCGVVLETDLLDVAGIRRFVQVSPLESG